MNSDAKWLIPGLLGVQAAFIGSTFGTWYTCLVLFSVFAFFAWLHSRWLRHHTSRIRISSSLRWLGNSALYLSTAFVIFLWRYGDYAGETINPMAFAFDAVAHTALVAALLLWTIHPLAGHPAMLAFGLLVVLLCVAAGGASHSMAGQIAVALAATIGYVFSANYILGHRDRSAASQLSHGANPTTRSGLSQIAGTADAGIADSGRIGILFSLLVLSAVLMTTSAIAHVTDYVLPDVQKTLHNQLTNSLEAIQDQSVISSSRYVRGSRIGSIRKHMLADPTAVALCAYATSAPGYLRGTVFDVYQDGRWAAISNHRLPNQMASPSIDARDVLPSGQGLTRLQGRASRTLRRFFLYEPRDERIASIEIHNDPLKGPVIFTPLATRWVEASSRAITVSHHDVIQAGVNIANPYVCGVANTSNRESVQPRRRSLLLQIPPGIESQIGELSRSICASHPAAPAKASAVSGYLRENYRYSLTEVQPRSAVDPIVQFLRSKHAAHCEYFATATVLLLRASGVPARYVTGYVTSEYSDEEANWVARNRDAHAWVEAYDDITGHWFPVESTPGRTYESLSLEGANSDFFTKSNSGQSDDDHADDSWFSLVWAWMTSMRATDPLFAIFRFGQIPFFCVLVFLLWKSIRRGYDNEANPEDVKSKQMLQRIDRKLKKLSLIRQPHETLHQFALRIEHAVATEMVDPDRHGDFLKQAASWYRQYAAARYRGQLPMPFGQAA